MSLMQKNCAGYWSFLIATLCAFSTQHNYLNAASMGFCNNIQLSLKLETFKLDEATDLSHVPENEEQAIISYFAGLRPGTPVRAVLQVHARTGRFDDFETDFVTFSIFGSLVGVEPITLNGKIISHRVSVMDLLTDSLIKFEYPYGTPRLLHHSKYKGYRPEKGGWAPFRRNMLGATQWTKLEIAHAPSSGWKVTVPANSKLKAPEKLVGQTIFAKGKYRTRGLHARRDPNFKNTDYDHEIAVYGRVKEVKPNALVVTNAFTGIPISIYSPSHTASPYIFEEIFLVSDANID